MSWQIPRKYKIWSRSSKWEFEVINERIIFTTNDTDNSSFTIKINDIDIVDIPESWWMSSKVRIVTSDDKMIYLRKIPSNSAKEIVQRLKAIKWHTSKTEELQETPLSTDTKKPYNNAGKISRYNWIMWSIVIFLTLCWLWADSIFSIFVFALCYWVWATKTLESVDQSRISRLRNYSHYPTRIFISWMWAFFNIIFLIQLIAEPKPIITIEWWSQQDVWSYTGFVLSIETKNINKLFINDESIIFTDNKYSKEYNLIYQTGINLTIKGINSKKSTTENLQVNRTISEQEQNEFEAKRKEEEKQRIEYENSPEYKAQKQKELVAKVINAQWPELYRACKNAITAQLNYPATADFPRGFNSRPYGENIVIKAYVKSKNGFWVEIVSNFRCEYKIINDTWTLFKADFE